MRSNADRVLFLIKALNQRGACSVVELQGATKMSRPAIYRLLRVLLRLDYVRQLPGRAKFQLTTTVRELNDLVGDKEELAEVAIPLLDTLQKEIIWPSSLSTFDAGKMVIRATTKSRSPLVFDRGHIGTRLPVLETAHGRAFLAFCSKKERRAVLNLLDRSGDPTDDLIKTPHLVTNILHETAKRRYAIRQGRFPENTSSIAVPVIVDDSAVGTLAVSFLSSALSVDQAAGDFLPQLRAIAAEIGRKIRLAPRTSTANECFAAAHLEA
jgi:IclR family mhp operon transcriptional activator